MPAAAPNIAALIVAAGRGTRARGQAGDPPKQYRKIGGEAVIIHTLRRFIDHDDLGPVVAVIHPDDQAALAAAAGDIAGRFRTVGGGRTRQLSVLAGLEALAEAAPDIVLIHDGVRPFLSDDLITRAAATALETGAALAATPVTDTLKRADANGRISDTVGREGLWAAQTPQAFRFDLILAAHRAANAAGLVDFTDDAAVAEWHGVQVTIVEGERGNTKLTTKEDLDMADVRLMRAGAGRPAAEIRTGFGYDVHGFAPGTSVMLGGVEIAHDYALSGHSDADVALHALTDAVLGAIAAGDIGSHFPPSDPEWRGAPSERFLAHAADLVSDRGGTILNLDVTLICEAPKIGPHRAAMRTEIARICGISEDRISVKATTTEGLGFTGRREGIAAQAVATVALATDEDFSR